MQLSLVFVFWTLFCSVACQGSSSKTRSPPTGTLKATRDDDFDVIPIPKSNFTRSISRRCSPIQQLAERIAWAESGILLDALERWSSKPPNEESDFQEAMDMYMGTHSGINSETGPRQRLAMYAAINRLRLFREGKLANDQIYVYCDESTFPESFFDRKECNKNSKSCCKDSINTYSWDFMNGDKNIHMLVLCPHFYASPSLSEQTRYVVQMKYMSYDSNKLYGNGGATILKQSFHWAAISQLNITESLPKPKESGIGSVIHQPPEVYSRANVASYAKTTFRATPTSRIRLQPDVVEEIPTQSSMAEKDSIVLNARMAELQPGNRSPIPAVQASAVEIQYQQSSIQAKPQNTFQAATYQTRPKSSVTVLPTNLPVKNTTLLIINPKHNKTLTSDCVSGNPLCAAGIAATQNVEKSFYNADSWAIVAGVIYQMQVLNTTTAPTPNNQTTDDKKHLSADKYTGPNSHFLGTIITPWIGFEENATPNRTTWVNSADVELYTKDYDANYRIKDIPVPSCIAKPYINTEASKDFTLKTITEHYCKWATSNEAPIEGESSQFPTAETPYNPKSYPVTGKDGARDMTLWVTASISQHPDCSGGYMLLDSICREHFRAIIDGCDGDDVENVQVTLMQDGIPPKGKFAMKKEGYYPY